jgi:hypothetical protein
MPAKQLLLYTCCSGSYVDYLTLWLYCAKKAYPEYDVKCDVQITTVPYYSACYRLLNQPTTHEYTYITDVDMMIMREPVGIMEYHTKEMLETGLCYSNTIRNSKNENLGDNRMTGLHFATKEWYLVTEKIRNEYLHMLTSGEIGTDYIHDELMLKQICMKTVGLPAQKYPLIKRHHGIHLGTVRWNTNKSANEMFSKLSARVSCKMAAQWLENYDCKEFKSIIAYICSVNTVIKKELEILYTFCRRIQNSGS